VSLKSYKYWLVQKSPKQYLTLSKQYFHYANKTQLQIRSKLVQCDIQLILWSSNTKVKLESLLHLEMSAGDGSVFCNSINGWLRTRRLAMWISIARCNSSFDWDALSKPSWYLAQSLRSSPTITFACRLPEIFCKTQMTLECFSSRLFYKAFVSLPKFSTVKLAPRKVFPQKNFLTLMKQDL